MVETALEEGLMSLWEKYLASVLPTSLYTGDEWRNLLDSIRSGGCSIVPGPDGPIEVVNNVAIAVNYRDLELCEVGEGWSSLGVRRVVKIGENWDEVCTEALLNLGLPQTNFEIVPTGGEVFTVPKPGLILRVMVQWYSFTMPDALYRDSYRSKAGEMWTWSEKQSADESRKQ
ncbi:MAG TPA: hypothetical protein V6D29_21665 [Leptolyngbyaceae cyanobacterium]